MKKALQAGLSEEDFEYHDEEFIWLVSRAEQKKAITQRVFKERFPEFDFVLAQEKLVDLLDELKRERMFVSVSSAVDEIFNGEEMMIARTSSRKRFSSGSHRLDHLLVGSNSDVLIKRLARSLREAEKPGSRFGQR